jgi:ribonuclease T1
VKNARALVAAGVIVILAGFLFVTLTGNGSGEPGPSATVSATFADGPGSPDPAAGQGDSGLPTVALTTLPAEAQRTYLLILDDGPYPYPQDDQVFGNREGILPAEPNGWYREYTVPTPGSPDRGARRFVVGEDGAVFYTDDHYDSFREVVQ